ncbi:MAG: alpha/beta hydrolase [Acidimicrobiia bacterium]|nr:alpha/beta hydrolase [Acidimicrobiia bacterium]
MSWAFLAVSLVGFWFTFNALRPTRDWRFLGPSFFAGWFTSEMPVHHLAWQAVATGVFVGLGALDDWPGWVGLAVTAASWAGLTSLLVISRRARVVVEDALREGLGPDFEDRIDPRIRARLGRRPSRAQLFLPLLLRDGRVRRIRQVPYAPGAGRRHRLDVYVAKVPAGERRPVLLQIHGGGWVIGDKGQQALPLMLDLAASGWVCVAANYRRSPRATWPDHLVDCKLALRWVREHVAEYGGDPDFVVVTGGSAGGHLSSMLALTPGDPAYQPGFEDADTTVAACVPFYGVYDFTDRYGIRGRRDPLARFLERLVVKRPFAASPEVYDRASPMSHVGPHAPPFFVIHGTLDNLAPVEEARKFAEMLREASTQPVLFAEIPGAHHAFEVFHSLRAGHVLHGVDRFLAWCYTRHLEQVRREVDEPPEVATG